MVILQALKTYLLDARDCPECDRCGKIISVELAHLVELNGRKRWLCMVCLGKEKK